MLYYPHEHLRLEPSARQHLLPPPLRKRGHPHCERGPVPGQNTHHQGKVPQDNHDQGHPHRVQRQPLPVSLPLQRREGDVNRLKYINPYPYEFITNISFVLGDYYISAYQ